MVYTAPYDSPVGPLWLCSDGEALTGLFMTPCQGLCIDTETLPVFQQTKAWLDAYFRGQRMEIGSLPVRLEGTEFQRRVWSILSAIPYGQLCTYGDIAREMEALLDRKMSAQAVGQAVGSNPVSIIIPCHRVVGAKGKLTGYAWGIDKKQWLLRLEGHHI